MDGLLQHRGQHRERSPVLSPVFLCVPSRARMGPRRNWSQSPLLYLYGVATFISELLGSLLGFQVLKKHFAKLQG